MTDPNLPALLSGLASEPEIDPTLGSKLRDLAEHLRESTSTARPFLSVLLRTQGRRLEPLKDALLCLAAQTDEDFEVIVLQHDAFPEDAEDTRGAVDSQPASFAARITVLPITGGTRAKPLNDGIRAARGQYIAVYDDDDLVMANWVEEFHAAAAIAPGQLLRAIVANQRVTPELWPHDQDGFRTGSWPAAEYPPQFDQLQHLLVNHSPFMSWAFPRGLFYSYGLRFDEELTVCEDWDMILRGSLLLGVHQIDALTSVYRRWASGESSYSLHSSESWRASERRVIDRLNASALVMPPGSMARLRSVILFTTALDNYRVLFDGTNLRWPINRLWGVLRRGGRFARRARNGIRSVRRRLRG
jgi:glycosyltransferase involved in cell wall biosynthesis